MGKMNRIYPKKSNGDAGIDCEVEKWCGEPAYQLSWTDKPVGAIRKDGTQQYERTMRYLCVNRHKFSKVYTVTKDLLVTN